MAARWECFQGLPPGWDAKFDFRTGRYYFIDNTSKQTTWEDPRLKSFPPPPPHPDTLPPDMRAPQTASVAPLVRGWGSPSLQGIPAPVLPPYALYGPQYPVQDVISFRGAGLPVVPGLPVASLPSAKETENEMDVAKLSAMFPTVPESRIKELLKKYHQRTAVVISALQVAKYPLATPGPYGTFTPPPARHFLPTAAALAAFQSSTLQYQQRANSTSRTTTLSSTLTSSSISTTGTIQAASPLKNSSFGSQAYGAHVTPPPPSLPTPATTGITSVSTISVSAAPLSFNSRPSTPERSLVQSRSSYERVRGTHLMERIGSLGDQSTVGGSLGSPKLSTRASSPHTTTRSTSEVTRSIISSPRLSQSPRPSPHSPKIKLRYLKGMFPNVDPITILDVLTQCAYNVKDACETLVSKGHAKKELSLLPPQLRQRNIPQDSPKSTPKPSPVPSRPKFLSEIQNRNIRQRLATDFPDVTPTVLRMALQSVGHDEELAKAVLTASQMDGKLKKEDKTKAITPGDLRRRVITDGVSEDSQLPSEAPVRPCRGVRPAPLPRPRVNFAWTHAMVHSSTSAAVDTVAADDHSSKAMGPDPALHQGPSDDLLLTNYAPWHGPNSENALGPCHSLAKGPNFILRRGPSSYVPRGANASLAKGARSNLAKGSIFSQALKKDSPPSSKRL
ncbi:WW domain [Trinorchestia longiramus]|nr:WW domain [Trinorchestia longiramus]